MEHIIQQIVAGAALKILDYHKENGIIDMDSMAEDLGKISTDMAKELLAAFVGEADKAICAAKAERKEEGYAIQERDVDRTVFTGLGYVSYRRTYFSNSLRGNRFILDCLLGIRGHERIGDGVSARMATAAAGMSYSKSANAVTGGAISRQSAWNKTMRIGEVAALWGREKQDSRILHIFADEDHVSLQDGTNTMVPLVTVCSGKQRVCKGRNELVKPMHIHGFGMKTDLLWEYVYAVCAQRYDMDEICKVFVYGDGAAWIAHFKNVFPGAVHVLDTFHYKKRIKRLFSGEACAPYGHKLHQLVRHDDKSGFLKMLYAMAADVADGMSEKERDKRLAKLKDDGNYLLSNWDAAQARNLPDAIGSCTEPMVSHVLSERLSRNPMGWSRAGLSKMAMVRVYCQNGGTITSADIAGGRSEKDGERKAAANIKKYDAIVKKQFGDALAGAHEWRWFERDSEISGKRTGTRQALDLLGKMRNVC